MILSYMIKKKYMWTTTAFNNKPVELYCGLLLKNKFNLISKVISKHISMISNMYSLYRP